MIQWLTPMRANTIAMLNRFGKKFLNGCIWAMAILFGLNTLGNFFRKSI